MTRNTQHGNLSLVLLYDSGTKKSPIPLFRTTDKDMLIGVARSALAEAEKRASVFRNQDPVLGQIEDAEVTRLRRVIDILLPDEHTSVVM